MAWYRAKGHLFVDGRLIEPGEEFESELSPGRNWEPLDAAEADDGDGDEEFEREEPRRNVGPVPIPEDWEHMPGFWRRGLAMRLGAPNTIKLVEANDFILAEIERRALAAA